MPEHDGLAAWLLAQIADDEATARSAKDNTEGEWALRAQDAPVVLYDASGKRKLGEMRHIAIWDPARALAECDAKRRLIEHVNEQQDSAYGEPGSFLPSEWLDVLKFLAVPYAGREGYRTEWRVE